MEKRIIKILKKLKISDLLPHNIRGNLVDLGTISKVMVKDKSVTFAIDIGILNLNPQNAKILEQRCKEQIIKNSDLEKINIILTAHKPEESKKNNQTHSNYNNKIDGVKRIIAIASGKGGVGKSTVAVNLAICLNKIGFKVGLVDADIYGPSIPHMMNLKGKPKLKNNQMVPINNYGVNSISIGLMVDKDQALVWRGPMVTKTLQQLIRNVNWDNIDYLIVDLPPGTGDAHLSMAQQFPLDAVVIVSTPQEIATIDAVKSIDMFNKLQIPIVGVIQNMSYLIDENSGKRNYLFGKDGAKKMAEKMKLNFLGEIPFNIKIRQAGDDKNPITNLEPSSPITFDYGRIAENIVSYVNNIKI